MPPPRQEDTIDSKMMNSTSDQRMSHRQQMPQEESKELSEKAMQEQLPR